MGLAFQPSHYVRLIVFLKSYESMAGTYCLNSWKRQRKIGIKTHTQNTAHNIPKNMMIFSIHIKKQNKRNS